MDSTSSAISVMRDQIVLLDKAMLLRTDSGQNILTTLYASMIARLMKFSEMV